MPSVFLCPKFMCEAHFMAQPLHFLKGYFIYSTGGVSMCRKNHLHGCCVLFFGLGLMIGHCLESWFLCSFGGLVLIGLGFCVMHRR